MSTPIQSITPMSPAEELDAIVRTQAGDPAAMEALVRAQVRYVAGEARRMASATVSEEDLLQVGLSALVEAVRAFDVTREGVRLYSFAKARIREAMGEERASSTTAMAIPGRTLRRYEAARRATSTLEQAAAYAEAQGMARDTFYAVADALNGAVFLDAPADEGTAPRDRVLIGRDRTPQPEQVAVDRATVASIIHAARLDTREERVVRLAFGLDNGGDALSDSEVAQALGVSRVTALRLRSSALAKLRAAA